jgi:bacteriocin-like protein
MKGAIQPAAKELSPEELNKVTGGLKIDDIP